MKKRKLLGLLSVFAIAIMLATGVSGIVVQHYYTIDNDDAQGFSNDRVGFDTWFQDTTLYYGDARKQECLTNLCYYDYYFPGYYRYTPIKVDVYAYLYNINFTDPSASYAIYDYSMYLYSSAGVIDQNNAPAGMNYIGMATTAYKGPDDIYYTKGARVYSSTGNQYCWCGADAIYVEIGY